MARETASPPALCIQQDYTHSSKHSQAMGGEDGCRLLPSPSHMLEPQGTFTSQEPRAGLEQLFSQASQATQNTAANGNSWKVLFQRPVEQLNRINPVYTLPANLPGSPSPSLSSWPAAEHPQSCLLTPEEQSRKGSTTLRKLRGYDKDNLWLTPASLRSAREGKS